VCLRQELLQCVANVGVDLADVLVHVTHDHSPVPGGQQRRGIALVEIPAGGMHQVVDTIRDGTVRGQ
jgi:hypothetical protein